MPKLSNQVAEAVKTAGESSGFTAMDEGKFRVRLVEVTAKEAKSSGNPMWTWKVEVLGPIEGGDRYKGRNLWINTVLVDQAMWKLAETFAAFGVPTDTDTDELLGCTAVATVIQREITQGPRAGQMGNDVSRLDPDTDPKAIRHPSSEIEGGVAAAPGATVVDSSEPVGNRF